MNTANETRALVEQVKAEVLAALPIIAIGDKVTRLMEMAFPDINEMGRRLMPNLGTITNNVLAKHGLAKLPVDTMRYLNGAIIVHCRGQVDKNHVAVQFRDQIKEERLDIALGLSPLTVGPAELMAVMHEATFEAPLEPAVSELYMWAARAAIEHKSGQVYPYAKDSSGPVRWLTEDDVLNNHPWCDEYRQIASSIRNKVVAEAKSRERTGRPAQTAPQAATDLFATA
jgi:hypothetical protein